MLLTISFEYLAFNPTSLSSLLQTENLYQISCFLEVHVAFTYYLWKVLPILLLMSPLLLPQSASSLIACHILQKLHLFLLLAATWWWSWLSSVNFSGISFAISFLFFGISYNPLHIFLHSLLLLATNSFLLLILSSFTFLHV